MAHILKRGLEEEGYVVSLASDGPSAPTSAKAARFDMILLDVMLPGSSGVEDARERSQSAA
jgi:DNA-binding response OmpR family regulator